MIFAGLMIAWTLIASHNMLSWLTSAIADPRVQAVCASLVLFAPASLLLGMISPYLARLNVKSVDGAGRAVANLGALDAIGGITGTFVTGFFLFGMIGQRETLMLIIGLLLVVSWIHQPRLRMARRIAVCAVVFVLVVLAAIGYREVGVSVETPSAHYQIVDFESDKRLIRGLITGPNGVQSGVYLDGDKSLPFWYTQQMAKLTIEAQPKRVLLLGGGTFTMAEYIGRQLPKTQIDVVEIDPALERIAREYFGYKTLDNVHLYFDDARSFVKNTTQTYDVVLVDAYGDGEVPYSLMTAEYGRELSKVVRPSGTVAVNLIVGLNNQPCRALFAAFDAVYRKQWPVAGYVAQNAASPRGNYVVVYKSEGNFDGSELVELPNLDNRLYTDNFVPSEQLYERCRQAATQ